MTGKFSIPNDQANEIYNANKTSTKIVLPFATLPIWWKNGAPAYKPTGGALYFGGWGSTAIDAENTLAEMQIDAMPLGFERQDVTSDTGKDYTAYFNRYVIAAVIARRQRWIEDPETHRKSSKINVLVYLASHDRKEKKYDSWGFGVLSASSWSGVALAAAITEFDRATAASRKEFFSDAAFKNGLPYNYFFAPLGTFQKDPVKELKGKQGSQSPITPCQTLLPEKITEKNLTDWYVGDDLAAIMYDALLNAKEWLDDWKRPENSRSGEAEQTDQVKDFNMHPDDGMPF